jgi:alkylhydroperoxidase family enzyme
MTEFTLYTEETASDASRERFQHSKKSFGMIPNLHATMAEAPVFLEAYQRVHELFKASSLNDEEQTVVWQSMNVEHECHYCVPAHTATANKAGVSPEISNALRNQTPLPEKLEALRTFTLQVVRQRGAVSAEEVVSFLDAGYTKQQIMEVILGTSQKVMSNYINRIAATPLDQPFQKFAWKKSD